MKCKHCGHVTNYKIRKGNGGQCESCKHQFAFEPKDNEHTIGDPLFDRAIQNVSSQNTLFFTRRQLWYEVERRLWRRRVSDSWGGFLRFAFFGTLISGFIAWVTEKFVFFFIGLAIAAVLVAAGGVNRVVQGRSTRHPAMTFATFNSTYFQKWVATHGEIEKLAPSNATERAPAPTDLNTAPFYELTKLPISSQAARNIYEYRSKGQVFEKLEDLLEVPGIGASTLEVLRSRLVFPPASEEPTEIPIGGESQDSSATSDAEFTEYSFDRALITDNAEIVDMLVANNFHFENNCALLSLDGHPPDIFRTVLEMLRRNPQLKVFAVHNASADGCSLPLTLRQEDWFPDPSITLVDLGLLPRHAKSMKLFTIEGQFQSLSPEVKGQLADYEVAWLEQGQSTEMEVLRPSRLLRAIYQGFGQAAQLEENQGGVWADNYYGGYYGFDSFG